METIIRQLDLEPLARWLSTYGELLTVAGLVAAAAIVATSLTVTIRRKRATPEGKESVARSGERWLSNLSYLSVLLMQAEGMWVFLQHQLRPAPPLPFMILVFFVFELALV